MYKIVLGCFDDFCFAMVYQLCLPLTEVKYNLNGRSPRPIPKIAAELLELNEDSPSGLVWRVCSANGVAKIGKPAGTPVNKGKYYQVSIKQHGIYYAHRIVYYLQNNQDPGQMVVRHLPSRELILGWQNDNGKDEKGESKNCTKNNIVGSSTGKMYSYQGFTFNLRSLCIHCGLNYNTIYQRIKRCKQSPAQAFAESGIQGVKVLFD